MKVKSRKAIWHRKIIAVFCFCCMVILYITPISAYATTVKAEDGIILTASLSSVSVTVIDNGQIKIEGRMSEIPFSVVGMLYNVYDGIDSNKVYFVESDPDYASTIYILNLEFETNASERNLSKTNKELIGNDIIRVAAYAEGKFYYAEQAYDIVNTITENTTLLSKTAKSPEMQAIISNASWYTHVEPLDLEFDNATRSIVPYSSSSIPSFGDSLGAVDIDVISKIGRTKFTGERFIYDWTNTGGYMIECVEWPTGTGNILTSCLYYEVVRNTPKALTTDAQIGVDLVVDRQYLYVAEENTIEGYYLGTDFRMYDVKLALACAQTSSNSGYDYIYKQTTSLTKNDNSHPSFTIAKAIAMQFDKYGILSVADAIFNAFSSNDTVSGTKTCSWPSNYSEHYASISHGKRMNTMLRGVRIDTDGYLLNEEGAYLLLDVDVVDRDYENSTTNVSMTKGIRFAFSYNLRSKNSIWFWIGGGNDRGDITYEGYKTYTK